MAYWTASVTRMRTTSSGGGNAVGIVTGMGATPERALAALRKQAEQLAQQAGEQAAEKAAEKAEEAAKKAQAERRAEYESKMRAASGGRGRPPWEADHRPQRAQMPRMSTARRDSRFEVIDVRLTPPRTRIPAAGWPTGR
jgi:hypothetical protein